jgi:hypothetical protein
VPPGAVKDELLRMQYWPLPTTPARCVQLDVAWLSEGVPIIDAAACCWVGAPILGMGEASPEGIWR